MVDFVTALATLSQALKLVQDLRGVEKAFDAAELRLKIADLTSSLADLKIALTDARDEVQTKDREINGLQKALQRKAETVEFRGYVYPKGESGNPQGHAFCPICMQKHGLFFNLVFSGGGQSCPNCKSEFGSHVVHIFGYDEETKPQAT